MQNIPKWRWVGHMMRHKKSNGSLQSLIGTITDSKRSRGRPVMRWGDEIKLAADQTEEVIETELQKMLEAFANRHTEIPQNLNNKY